jgi:hypothetical protein
MLVDDFINLVKKNGTDLGPLLEQNSAEKLPHIKITDMFATHLGLHGAPKKVSDTELDRLVSSGSATEMLRGTGTEDVATSFLSGTSGFGSYDEGGPGHYFTMESLSKSEVKKMGLAIDPDYRGTTGASMTYQASHFAGDGKTMIRAGLPADARIGTLEAVQNEIANLKNGKGQLAVFRGDLVDSGDMQAVNLFDNIFRANSEDSSGIAGMILGYDGMTISEGANEIKILDRSKLLTTEARTLEQMDALYPRTKPNGKARGALVRGHHIDSHSDRRALLEKRATSVSSYTAAAPPKPSYKISTAPRAPGSIGGVPMPKMAGRVVPPKKAGKAIAPKAPKSLGKKLIGPPKPVGPRAFTALGRSIGFMEETKKLNAIRPLPKAALSVAPPSVATAVVSAATTAAASAATSAGASSAVKSFLKSGVTAASGNSVLKKMRHPAAGVAAIGLATSVAISKRRLNRKEEEQRRY